MHVSSREVSNQAVSGECYVFVRCWPAFTEKFPFEEFDEVPDVNLLARLERKFHEAGGHIAAHGVGQGSQIYQDGVPLGWIERAPQTGFEEHWQLNPQPTRRYCISKTPTRESAELVVETLRLRQREHQARPRFSSMMGSELKPSERRALDLEIEDVLRGDAPATVVSFAFDAWRIQDLPVRASTGGSKVVGETQASNDQYPGAEEADASKPPLALPGTVGPDEGGAELSNDLHTAVLRRNGTDWLVGYDGELKPMAHRVGFIYLQELVARSNQPVSAASLFALGRTRASRMNCDAGAAVGLEERASPNQGAEDVLDDIAEAQIENRIRELAAENDDLEEIGGDEERRALIQEEIRQLAAELGKSRGLGRQRRKLGDADRRQRKSVGQQISRAILAIEKELGPLGSHLDAAIEGRSSEAPVYRQIAKLAWDLGDAKLL